MSKMSGIVMSLGRAAPRSFSPKGSKTLYQEYNGGGSSGFRGLHDVSINVLTPGMPGVQRIDPNAPPWNEETGWVDPNQPGLLDELPDLPALPSLKGGAGGFVSIARGAGLVLAGVKAGGLFGAALIALAVPDALSLLGLGAGTGASGPGGQWQASDGNWYPAPAPANYWQASDGNWYPASAK